MNNNITNKELAEWSEELTIRPMGKIKKNCLCCGIKMELFVYEDRDFCDRCFLVVCQEVFNKNNDNLTVEELKNKIKEKVNKKIQFFLKNT